MPIVGYKSLLCPNNKQRSEFFRYAGASRFIYNWTLDRQWEHMDKTGVFLSDLSLRKELTSVKKTEKLYWLNSISNDVLSQAIKDACSALKRHKKGFSCIPRYKSKKNSKLSFYQGVCKIKFTDNKVRIEKLSKSKRVNRQSCNWVRLAQRGRVPYGGDVKHLNPRVSFDGLNWYVSVSVEVSKSLNVPKGEGIGIDVGIKDLAICSNGNTYKNINKSKEVKGLKKRLKRQQRKMSRKLSLNKCVTNNYIKAKKEALKTYKKIANIRTNHLHKVTSEVIGREPIFICLEDLNVQGMLKNRHLAKSVREQSLYELKRIFTYKAYWNNIKVIEADRFFPSSKTCSSCGCVKKDLKLSDRVFNCTHCGSKIDRDMNASYNLREYGRRQLTT